MIIGQKPKPFQVAFQTQENPGHVIGLSRIYGLVKWVKKLSREMKSAATHLWFWSLYQGRLCQQWHICTCKICLIWLSLKGWTEPVKIELRIIKHNGELYLLWKCSTSNKPAHNQSPFCLEPKNKPLEQVQVNLIECITSKSVVNTQRKKPRESLSAKVCLPESPWVFVWRNIILREWSQMEGGHCFFE